LSDLIGFIETKVRRHAFVLEKYDDDQTNESYQEQQKYLLAD